MTELTLPRPWAGAGAAAGLLGLLALYVVGIDQGHLFSLVQGTAAFDLNLIHEFLHDARHSAGFPCH